MSRFPLRGVVPYGTESRGKVLPYGLEAEPEARAGLTAIDADCVELFQESTAPLYIFNLDATPMCLHSLSPTFYEVINLNLPGFFYNTQPTAIRNEDR